MAERSQLVVKKPDAKRDNSVSKSRKPGYSQSMSSPTDRILFLQRTIGNQAMQRLIKSGALQTKLRISQSGDKYEQEADLIADTVLQMPKPKAVDHSDGEPSIQRICLESEKEELRRQPIEDKEREKIVQPKLKIDREHIQLQAEEEEEEELLQTKEISDQNTEITPDLDSHIQALSGGGKPLPESVHSFFESRFGYDFNHVRLHTDKPAADVTRAVNAKAFTISQNIVFGAGQFAPETNAGRWLLAHELAHTIQQRHDLVPPRVHNLTPSQPSIQRVCRSRAIGRPSGCTPVSGVSVFDISSSSDELYLFDRNCDDFKPGHESRLRRLAARFGPNDVIETHGFASEEGPAEFNEHLSCARALKAESVLTGAGILPARISVFKHGATPGPRIEHRSVVIPLPTSTPTPGPGPSKAVPTVEEQQRICGPDITSSLTTMLGTVDPWFRGLSTFQKRRSCVALGPGAPLAGVNPIMAWDTRELFLPNTDWLDDYFRLRSCGSPRDAGCDTDPTRNLCETAGSCGNSVVVGGKCLLAGTANYALFGTMCRLCHDETSQWGRWDMRATIGAYKTIALDNSTPPKEVASTAYDGTFPTLPAAAENRGTCTGRCGLTHGGAFDFIWEPYKPR